MAQPGFPAGRPRDPVTFAAVTDGLSNTIMLGESAHGKTSVTFPAPCNASGGCTWSTQGWWADSDFGDGSMSTFWPMNLQGADLTILPGPCDPSGSIVGSSASSYHSGGCIFAMGDGSVRFIQNTVNSWNPLAVPRDANCIPRLPTGNAERHLPGPLHSKLRRDGLRRVLGPAFPTRIRAAGLASEPQVIPVLFEIADKQIADAEEDRQPQAAVP